MGSWTREIPRAKTKGKYEVFNSSEFRLDSRSDLLAQSSGSVYAQPARSRSAGWDRTTGNRPEQHGCRVVRLVGG
jgi:hypothetical protein